MARGKIITIEGTDGTGKSTQKKTLVKRAEEAGYKTFSMKFPNYDSKWGRKVKQYLRGEFGNVVDPMHASTLYAFDREENQEEFEEKLSKGVNIILDRYVESNLAYQGSKLKGRKRTQMIDWIWTLETKLLEVKPSDYVLFLDLPVKYSDAAVKQRNEKQSNEERDIHEENLEHMIQTYKTYKTLAKRDNWITVPCIKGIFGKRRYTVEELSDKIWKVAEGLLVK
ncbi:MAG: dTMP kinase [archaeon]